MNFHKLINDKIKKYRKDGIKIQSLGYRLNYPNICSYFVKYEDTLIESEKEFLSIIQNNEYNTYRFWFKTILISNEMYQDFILFEEKINVV